MGFLESLKQSFNVHGVEVTVVTEDEIYSQFDRIAGEVIVRGGEYARSGDSIKLHLKEFWTEARSNGKSTTTVTVYEARDEITLADAFTIDPESEHAYPFEVQLPINCRISTKSTGWCLTVALDIPKAIDPKGKVILDVKPGEEFLAVVDVFESCLRFEEDTRKRRWRPKTSETHFRLLPPTVLKAELDYVRLELQQTNDGGITGHMVFDLQEKSITDYLKSVVNADKIKKPIHISRDQIFSSDGQTNSEVLTLLLYKPIEEMVIERTK